jgi:hypothetical protein
MQGGGYVRVYDTVKHGVMSTGRLERAMSITGEYQEEERKLRLRLKDQKWYLDENLRIPQCKGPTFDKDEDYSDRTCPKCKVCTEYASHVGEAFTADEGTLKAAMRLAEIYAISDTHAEKSALSDVFEGLCLKVALSEAMDKKNDKEVKDLRTQLWEADGHIARLTKRMQAL